MQLLRKKNSNGNLDPTFINFQSIDEDGFCYLDENKVSIMVEIDEINYQLCSEDRQIELFGNYSDFFNSLPDNIEVQLSIQKVKKNLDELREVVYYEDKKDGLDAYRLEMNQLVGDKLTSKESNYSKKIFFVFTTSAIDHQTALGNLEVVLNECEMFSKSINSKVKRINGIERINYLKQMMRLNDHPPIFESNGHYSTQNLVPKLVDYKKDKKGIYINDVHCTVYSVNKYPTELSDTLLTDIYDVLSELTISLIIKPMSVEKAFDLVRTKLTFMEQQKVEEQKKAIKQGYDFDMLPYELSYSLSEGQELLENIQSNGEKLFDTTVLIYVAENNEDEFTEVTSRVEGVCRRHNLDVVRLPYIQESAFMNVLPLGFNNFPISRTLTTSNLGVLTPFAIPELIQKNGKYYGINRITNNLISLDRKKLKAPSGFVLGTPGSGKSFSVKREIVNIMFRDVEDEIIIIDPENEYKELALNFGGQCISISAKSDQSINPLELHFSHEGMTIEEAITLKSEFLISLFDLLIGGVMGLSPTQKTIIDRTCRFLYHTKEFLNENIQPTLVDLYHHLLNQNDEESQLLAIDLELYIVGSLSVFSKQSNVKIENRLIVFEIKDLGQQLKTLGMLIVLDKIWNRITENREKGIRTWVYIDEMQLLFSNEYSSNYFFELWSRSRKWGAIPTGITQNVETLLLSDMARRMLSNSDYVMLLNQAKSDRTQVVNLFDISAMQEKYLMNSGEGSGLIIYDELVIPFYDKFPTNTKLYQLMTTKPDEIKLLS